MTVTLKLPFMRYELIGCLEDLSNVGTQEKEWTDPSFPHAFWDNIVLSTDPIDYFDSVVKGAEQESFQEGYILFNSEETKAVMKVVWAFDKVIKQIGIDKPDSAYINSPLWNDVVSSSQEAYDLLVSNNKKYGLDFEKLWEQEKQQDS